MIHSMHIIGSRNSGGAERCFLWLTKALALAGHPVTAVNRPESLIAGQLGGIPQVHVPMRNYFDLPSKWKISGCIRSRKPQVVLTYMSRATSLTNVKPGSGTVHIARLDGYYKMKYFRHAHAWVGVTKGMCDLAVKEGLPADRVFHISNFVDGHKGLTGDEKSALRAALKIPSDAVVVMAAGRFIWKKGFDTLITAFSRLPAEVNGRPLRLLLVGDGELSEALQRHARENGVNDRTVWAGWQADPDPFYQIADVVAFPSRIEAHGNITKEAWAHGKAVVSTRTEGSEELIEDGETGLLVPVDDSAAMAHALRLVLEDDHLREALARRGSERLASEYGKDKIIKAWLELFSNTSRN